jgi:hypothetical protein
MPNEKKKYFSAQIKQKEKLQVDVVAIQKCHVRDEFSTINSPPVFFSSIFSVLFAD